MKFPNPLKKYMRGSQIEGAYKLLSELFQKPGLLNMSAELIGGEINVYEGSELMETITEIDGKLVHKFRYPPEIEERVNRQQTG